MKRIAVFCGSSPGNDETYIHSTRELAKAFLKKDIGLVYGGGNVGLMGILADEMLKGGGDVIGIIPQKLADLEVAHRFIKDLRIVSSMHERKAIMAELADAFIALPGGIGTLEEIIEVFTWTQLGFHLKPCGILNISNFYDLLDGLLNKMVSSRFLKEEHKNMLLFDDNPDRLVERLFDCQNVYSDKWENMP